MMEIISRGYFKSPTGIIMVEADEKYLLKITFLNGENCIPAENPNNLTDDALSQIEEYFNMRRRVFKLSYRLSAKVSEFQKKALIECSGIPYGDTAAYGQVASRIGFPGAARAVGQAMAKNPLPIIIPCHRVLGINGRLTGYSGSISRKKYLLDLEKRGDFT